MPSFHFFNFYNQLFIILTTQPTPKIAFIVPTDTEITELPAIMMANEFIECIPSNHNTSVSLSPSIIVTSTVPSVILSLSATQIT